MQGLNNKIDQLSIYLGSYDFDVVCLGEHWFPNDILNYVNIYNYKLVSHFSRSEHSHGGVCMYSRPDLQCGAVNLDRFCLELHAEFCGLNVVDQGLLVLAVYRPFAGDKGIFIDLFNKLLDEICMRYERVVILGDFNFHFDKYSKQLNDLLNVADGFGLKITIFEPTRVTDTSSSYIDNIFTNLSSSCFNAGVIGLDISDHFAQYINISMKNKRDTNYSELRKITEGGVNSMRSCLLGLDWSRYYLSDNVELLCSVLLGNITSLIPDCFPLKRVSVYRPPIKWFDDHLKAFRNTVSAVKLISEVSKDPGDRDVYNAIYAEYKRSITLSKKHAYSEYISRSDNKMKDIWKVVNFERGHSVCGSNKSCSISADDFNKYFTTVASEIIRDLPVNDNLQRTYLSKISLSATSFFLPPVVGDDVRLAVCGIKRSNCVDIYNISSILLKRLIDILAEPLAHLFNVCILQGCFPEAFKLARVVPVHKKGDINCTDNYRPISVVPLFGKIFEIIIAKHLSRFFEMHNMLSNAQYGFRGGHSTVDAVSSVVGHIVGGLERGELVGLTLCDLSKAFDCVSHRLLIEKLYRYGVRGAPLNLIKSYLSSRQQCVSFNDVKSSYRSVANGVPQGSVMGPLLFVIYINDLVQHLCPRKCVLYADDATLIYSDKLSSNFQSVRDDIEAAAEMWFASNYLSLNANKTQRLVFSTTGSTGREGVVKLLGVMVDDRLNWTPHVEYLKSRLAPCLYVIRRLRDVVDREALLTVYHSLFNSYISYGIILWGGSAEAVSLFRLQKKAIRLITKSGYLDHCRPLFVSLHILTLPSLYIYYTLCAIHKNRGVYSLNSDFHNYNTRGANYIRPSGFRLTRSVKNTLDVRLFNLVPTHIQELNYLSFKRVIRNFLLRHAFYSVREYTDALSSRTLSF